MAVTEDKDVQVPKSTGAKKTPTEPVTTEQVTDNTSTGAVEQDTWGETTVDYHGADAVVRSETPSEPVTMTVSWKADTETKVVTPEPSEDTPKSTDVAETK